jgi:2'-hydroxyisoflavone reductase
VGRYVFVSTVSVYAAHDTPASQAEDAAVLDLAGVSDDPGEQYGAKKAACEAAVRELLGERATIARPGLIVGPHDPTDRFGYWPRRLAAGGRVLAPGTPSDHLQFIDVRDLGEWLVHAALDDVGGVFNLVATPVGFGELLEACRVPGVPAEVSWIASEALIAEGVEQWTELPLWVREAGWEAMNDVPNERALAAGLEVRPLAETVAGAREDATISDHTLTRDREQELLAKLAS